jgi:cytochrome c oxidase assembly factor CtaG
MTWADPLSWPIHWYVVLGAEAVALLYLLGRSRRPRLLGARRGWGSQEWRATALYTGLAVVLVALNSPIEALARQLFWVHMIQHLLLIMVAAPLVALGAPGLHIWRGVPLTLRRPLAAMAVRGRWLLPLRKVFHWATKPVWAWVLFTANLWLWHLPQAYDLTLRNHTVHHLEHGLFLGVSFLFWAQVIDQRPFRCALGQLQRAVYVFLSMLQAWVLAVVLGLATAPYYAYSLMPVRPGGISALADQQIGAGIMWVPGSITFAIALVACLHLWLRDEESAAQQADRGAFPGSARRSAQLDR